MSTTTTWTPCVCQPLSFPITLRLVLLRLSPQLFFFFSQTALQPVLVRTTVQFALSIARIQPDLEPILLLLLSALFLSVILPLLTSITNLRRLNSTAR